MSSTKTLYVLRHATTQNHGASGDKSRHLAPTGIKEADALGQFMVKNKYLPSVALCSSAIRTRETLETLNAHLNITDIRHLDILYSGSTGDYLYEIQQVHDDHDNILIVAHNPCIYELVILLAAQGDDAVLQKASLGYSPASLSVIECVCDKWEDIQPVINTLLNLVNPSDYNS